MTAPRYCFQDTMLTISSRQGYQSFPSFTQYPYFCGACCSKSSCSAFWFLAEQTHCLPSFLLEWCMHTFFFIEVLWLDAWHATSTTSDPVCVMLTASIWGWEFYCINLLKAASQALGSGPSICSGLFKNMESILVLCTNWIEWVLCVIVFI